MAVPWRLAPGVRGDPHPWSPRSLLPSAGWLVAALLALAEPAAADASIARAAAGAGSAAVQPGRAGPAAPSRADAAAASRCGALAPHLRALAPDLWWLPGAGGASTPHNRGAVVNLLLARHGGRLWLIGSGPSPAFARALRCEVRRQLGQDIAEVVNPYARAELVLGNAGMGAARIRAPAAVLAAMRHQCPGCVERLRGRLGEAAVDLGAAPVRLPEALAAAEPGAAPHGRWGPFEFTLVARGGGSTASVWRHPAAGVVAAWGLLWFDGAPDGADTQPREMIVALDTVLALTGDADRVIGEAGAPARRGDVALQRDYWQALWREAEAGVKRGGTWSPAALGWVGPPQWQADARHALNAQRAWRLAEDALLAAPAR